MTKIIKEEKPCRTFATIEPSAFPDGSAGKVRVGWEAAKAGRGTGAEGQG